MMAEASVYVDTRRFAHFSLGFLHLFEFDTPCQLYTLRQLHGPLTRANALRDAILRCGKIRQPDRVIEILYSARTMRPMGLVIDVVPQKDEALVQLVCHRLNDELRRIDEPH